MSSLVSIFPVTLPVKIHRFGTLFNQAWRRTTNPTEGGSNFF
jgi:hypothetical protein